MAALSTTLLAYASPDKLTVNYFSSGDVTKDWSLEMKEGEKIETVAVGQEWVAIATSANKRTRFGALDSFSSPLPVGNHFSF